MSKDQKRILAVMALVMVLIIGAVVLWAVQRENAREVQAGQDMAGIYYGTTSP